MVPPSNCFIDVYTHAGAAVAEAQATWMALADPTEIARDLDAQNRFRPHHLRRRGPAGQHR